MTNIEMQTLSAVQTACRCIVEYTDNAETVNWEQRRYEIARELFVRGEHSAIDAVSKADELIWALKK